MVAICSKCLQTMTDDRHRCGQCGGLVVQVGETTHIDADGSNLTYSAWDLPKLFEDLESGPSVRNEAGR